MVMKKRYVNALLLGMSLCVAAPGTAVSASEIPAQESAVEDTSDAELEAIMREAEAAAAGASVGGNAPDQGGSPAAAGTNCPGGTECACRIPEKVSIISVKI